MSQTPNLLPLLPKTGVKITKRLENNQGWNFTQTETTEYEGLALIRPASEKDKEVLSDYGIESNRAYFLYLGTEDNTISSRDIPNLKIQCNELKIGQNLAFDNNLTDVLTFGCKGINMYVIGQLAVDNKQLILSIL